MTRSEAAPSPEPYWLATAPYRETAVSTCGPIAQEADVAVVGGGLIGLSAAMRILRRPEGETAFADTRFARRIYYTGRPWFMPIADRLFDAKDRIESLRAGVAGKAA